MKTPFALLRSASSERTRIAAPSLRLLGLSVLSNILLTLGLVFALGIPAPAAQLVLWSFPSPLAGIANGTPIAPNVDNVVGSPTLELRNQTIDSNGKDGVAYTDSIGTLRPATTNGAIAWDDFRGPGNDGELWITFNTTGFVDISVRFDVKLNDNPIDNSIRLLKVEWSTDGVNFTQITNFQITNNDTFSARNVPMTAISAVENAPQVIVRLSQGGTADADAMNDSVSFDNIEVTGTVDPGSVRPVLTVAAATTDRLDTAPSAPPLVTGAIGDPTDPAAQQGIVFTLSDPNTPVGSLTLTATSSNQTVVPNANLAITGTGASRTLKITPAAVGSANITVTVADPQGNSADYTINYAASAGSSTPSISRYHTGSSDASAAVPIAPGLVLVGNDEDQVLRLYDRANSGLPIAGFDMNASLALVKEADIETAVRIGNRVYWIGSHGNERDGDDAPPRRTAFSTDLTGSGTTTVPVFVNRYTGLRTDLINWDNANGHGLGAGALGLQASAAAPKLPTVPDGFNIEGATLAPGSSTILLGFRAPLQSTANRNRALVIPATNLTTAIDTGIGPVTFGAPLFLDLGGRAIRSMDTTASGQILILAGPVDDRVAGVEANTFRFFLWDGSATNPPLPLTSNIDAIAANAFGSPEAVFDLPATLVSGSSVGVLIDNGSTDHYGTGAESKDLAAAVQKFREDTVTLTSLPLLVTTNANANAGSLRQAIADAPAGATINFAAALSGQVIRLTTGHLVLSKNLTIDASALPGGITISGEDASRIFEVSAGPTVVLKGLTLQDGFADQGGAIRNNGGTLTVTSCTLLGNGAQYGGAVYSNTDLSAVRTTLVNSTITGNFATVQGGGVYNFDGLTEVLHCTITANAMPTGTGGGIVSFGDSATRTDVANSIVADNATGDVTLVSGTTTNSFISSGGNLIGTGVVLPTFTQTGDLTAAAPLLQPLGRYGGPTDTMPPRLGSQAIDRAASSTTTTDQRGAARPQNGDFSGAALADSGAVEFVPALVTNANDSGPGSLRAAVTAPFASTVTFDTPTFNGEPADTITLATELALNRRLIIDGTTPLAGVKISGNNVTRVFNLGAGASITLRALTITGGNSGGNAGGGINVDGGAQLELIDSLIAGNATTYVGGGLMVFNGAVTITNSTLAQNSANDGAAIWCQGPSTLNLRHTTVSGNAGIRAVLSFVGMRLENSIVAGNAGDNLLEVATLAQAGFNLTAGDPLLMPLGNYGGRTPTMPPQPGSSAIDAAAASTVNTDQRGAARPNGVGPEIGAVESVPATVTSSGNSGPGTLRAALALPFASAVDFSPSVFNGEPGDTIVLGSELVLAKSVFIDASALARGVTISGGNSVRIFRVSAGETAAFRNLTLTAGSSGEGGAIFSEGTVALERSTLSGNHATFVGGAISSRGPALALTQCTLAENTVSAGGVNNGGGAIFNLGTLALTHCTISGNTTAQQNQGGGIINAGPATLAHCIVAGNSVGPGGIGADIRNEGPLTFVGNNIIQGIATGPGGSNSGPSPINAPPLLAPLGDYGGPTRTMALLPGSPARNAATGSTITTDQRNFVVLSAPPDLGAYEAGNPGGYDAWASENIPPSASHAFSDDADRNGLANGLEYAFYTDALGAHSSASPKVIPNGTRTLADLVFPIRIASSDLIYEIQRSTTLTTWTPVAAVDLRDGSTPSYDPAVVFLDVNGTEITFRDSSFGGRGRVFYRLNVIRP